MDIKEILLQWFINFLITSGGGIKNENIYNNELAEELHKPYLHNYINLREEKFNYLLYTKFGVLILLICNYHVNLIKESVFHYMLLTFIANMHGLLL